MIRRLIRAIIYATACGLIVLLALIGWQHYAPRPPASPLVPLTGQIDRIEVDKSDRLLTVFRDDVALRSYDIALGFTPDGDKFREGDGKTPEGTFTINRRNPESAFHLSLGIDYPQAEDRALAQAAGVSPGGDIFIHGQPNKLKDLIKRPGDWTAGCIAVTNAQIEEIWRVTPNGTTVVIRP
ncbi:murein L,D-transpeptidase family protein [Roseovarius sp. EL26]|uniref:L,D-transpeptidase family protein n=1 Tax=Roseovarius sp. EL26 TaxID=2126672 RepID=UPI000EA26160|nr:L,D-transpeptidase family protein [Roseovarius sp. EL26]